MKAAPIIQGLNLFLKLSRATRAPKLQTKVSKYRKNMFFSRSTDTHAIPSKNWWNTITINSVVHPFPPEAPKVTPIIIE